MSRQRAHIHCVPRASCSAFQSPRSGRVGQIVLRPFQSGLRLPIWNRGSLGSYSSRALRNSFPGPR